MAANSGGGDSTGRKNYYNIAYGMLSSNSKTAPEGYEKISLSEIKAKRQKNENVDLRSKYYDKENGKDYPLRVFYTDIDGIIDSIEKNEYSQGISLNVTLHDGDGDESVIQTDFYGKVSADFMNRLLSVNPSNSLNFRPYSIPTSAKLEDGTDINYYNSGVSIKDNGVKMDRAFKKENGLPSTERIRNAQGKEETSRVKQIDFLWEKVKIKFANLDNKPAETSQADQPTESSNTAPTADTAPANTATQNKDEVAGGVKRDDLPF